MHSMMKISFIFFFILCLHPLISSNLFIFSPILQTLKNFIMKKLFFLTLVFIGLVSCKKEGSLSNKADADSTQIQSSDSVAAFKVDQLSDKAGEGKTIFTKNGETIISFDTRSNIGTVSIDGTKFSLNQLIFSENTYEIKGDNISIVAEDGNFDDTSSQCTSGSFPEIRITQNNHTTVLHGINVQDCTSYN